MRSRRGLETSTSLGSSIESIGISLRNKLVEEGVLQHVPNGLDAAGGLKFTADYLFGSPSTAAGVVLGRNANGRTEWKDASVPLAVPP